MRINHARLPIEITASAVRIAKGNTRREKTAPSRRATPSACASRPRLCWRAVTGAVSQTREHECGREPSVESPAHPPSLVSKPKAVARAARSRTALNACGSRGQQHPPYSLLSGKCDSFSGQECLHTSVREDRRLSQWRGEGSGGWYSAETRAFVYSSHTGHRRRPALCATRARSRRAPRSAIVGPGRRIAVAIGSRWGSRSARRTAGRTRCRRRSGSGSKIAPATDGNRTYTLTRRRTVSSNRGAAMLATIVLPKRSNTYVSGLENGSEVPPWTGRCRGRPPPGVARPRKPCARRSCTRHHRVPDGKGFGCHGTSRVAAHKIARADSRCPRRLRR